MAYAIRAFEPNYKIFKGYQITTTGHAAHSGLGGVSSLGTSHPNSHRSLTTEPGPSAPLERFGCPLPGFLEAKTQSRGGGEVAASQEAVV